MKKKEKRMKNRKKKLQKIDNFFQNEKKITPKLMKNSNKNI